MNRKLLPAIVVTLTIIPAATWAVEVTLPTTLDALVDDPSNPNDDANAFFLSPSGRFRFSDFTYSPLGVGTTPPGDTNVQVTITESSSEVSVLLDFLTNGTATGPGAYELALEYLAEVVDPNFAFVSHTLAMNSSTQGDGRVFINEEILAPGGGGIGTLSTTDNVPNRPDTFSDTLAFLPTRTMTVHNKDMSVSGGAAGGGNSATLTRVEQSFAVIPEPSSILLVALGALGVGMFSRRFHRT